MFNNRITRCHSYNLRKQRKVDYGESSGTETNEDELCNKVPYTPNCMKARYTGYNNIIKFCKIHTKSRHTKQIQYKIRRNSSLTKIYQRRRVAHFKIRNGKHLFRVAKNIEKSKKALNMPKKFLNFCEINGYIKEFISSYKKLYEFSDDLFPIELISKNFCNDFNKMIGVKKIIDENLQYFVVSENFIKQSSIPWIAITLEVINMFKEVLKIKQTIETAEITYDKNINKIHSRRLIILMDLFALVKKKIDMNALIRLVNFLYINFLTFKISRGPELSTAILGDDEFYIFFDVGTFVDKENTKSFYFKSTQLSDNKDNINVPKDYKVSRISNENILIHVDTDSCKILKEYPSNNNNKSATKRNKENEKETNYFEKKKLEKASNEDIIFPQKEDEILDLYDSSDDEAFFINEFDEIYDAILKNLENSEKEENTKSIKENVPENVPLQSGNKISATITSNDDNTKSQVDIALDCAKNQQNELLYNNCCNDINNEEIINISNLELNASKSITQVKRKEFLSSQDINIQNNSKVIDNLTNIQPKKAVKHYERKRKNLSNILTTKKSTKPILSNLETKIDNKSFISYPVKKDTILKKKCSKKGTFNFKSYFLFF